MSGDKTQPLDPVDEFRKAAVMAYINGDSESAARRDVQAEALRAALRSPRPSLEAQIVSDALARTSLIDVVLRAMEGKGWGKRASLEVITEITRAIRSHFFEQCTTVLDSDSAAFLDKMTKPAEPVIDMNGGLIDQSEDYPCPFCKQLLESRDGYYICHNKACSFPLGYAGAPEGETAGRGPA